MGAASTDVSALWHWAAQESAGVGGCCPSRSAADQIESAAAALLLLYGAAAPWPTYAASFLFAKHTDAQLWVRLGASLGTILNSKLN